MKQKSNEISLTGVKSLPYKENGKVLNDLEFVKKGLELVEKYREENDSAPPIHPAFIEFMQDIKAESEKDGFDIVEYKNQHVHKLIPDYSVLKNVD